MPKKPITKISLKITYLKFHSNLQGADDLNEQWWFYFEINSCFQIQMLEIQASMGGKVGGREVRYLKELYYRKTSNISRTLVGNKIVDNSDAVGASPVGAAPTTSSIST